MDHVLPRTVEEVVRDFKGRRTALIKALTIDVAKFYKECDPGKDNLCLYGLPNESWEVNIPVEEVPPELPEPALGINFVRDGLRDKDWLSLVAVHSDSWLLSVAFYFGARFGFDRNKREKLFLEMNELPTLFEIVAGNAKQPKEQADTHDSKSKSSEKKQSKGVEENALPKEDDDSGEEREVDEEKEDEDEQLCGACGDAYVDDEFWIFCEICEKWFHGDCVEVTEEKAEHIKHYKCPTCEL